MYRSNSLSPLPRAQPFDTFQARAKTGTWNSFQRDPPLALFALRFAKTRAGFFVPPRLWSACRGTCAIATMGGVLSSTKTANQGSVLLYVFTGP